jgi:hypothetical protein
MHGHHPKIDGVLHHSARARKQKTLKILRFVICVEDEQTDTNTVFNPVPPWQFDVRVDKNVACLGSLLKIGRTSNIPTTKLRQTWYICFQYSTAIS